MPRRERTPKDPEGRMPLKAHLLEFRNRLIKAALAIFIGAIVGWIIYNPVQIGSWTFAGVYDQLTYPFDEYKATNPDSVVTLNFGNATSAFTTQLGLSLFTGVVISSPIWVWQIWAFILPGLTKKERRLSLGVFSTALPLFLAGCFFAYQTLPKALLILFGFTP
ncbi:MAG: twin-arginine translocase subunit TatC, partial [Janibacter sp.]|nr:twin-arginine translocase subunit TatC [Janibacter sp.]